MLVASRYLGAQSDGRRLMPYKVEVSRVDGTVTVTEVVRPRWWEAEGLTVVGVLLLMWLAAALWTHVYSPRDDSDNASGERSGLTIHTDALTGCQYLRASYGGITPRLGKDGKQVCK